MQRVREWIAIPAVAVEVVDATGAGDIFCGGALAGFAEENDPITALIYGAVSASFCIEGPGFAGLTAATCAEAVTRVAQLRERRKSGSLPIRLLPLLGSVYARLPSWNVNPHPVCEIKQTHDSYPSGHGLTGYLEALEQISRWYRAKDNRRSLRDDNQENRIPA